MITPAYSPTATERVLPRLALDFTTGVLDPRITVTRALNTATAIGSNGFIAAVNANLPRFDFDPVTQVCKGLLIEEARTNLQFYSEDFSSWLTLSNATAPTVSFRNPANGSTVSKLTENTATAGHLVGSGNLTVASGATVTLSVYAKPAGRNWIAVYDSRSTTGKYFDVANGVIGGNLVGAPVSASISPGPDGYYRCSITVTVPSTIVTPQVWLASANGTFNYQGDGTSGAYLYGFQTEVGTFATSYIPNLALGSTTRNADVVSMTGANFSDWFNASEGTFMAYVASLGVYNFNSLIDANNGTTLNRIGIRYNSATVASGIIIDNNVQQGPVNPAAPNAAASKFVLAYKANSFAAAYRGSAVATDTSGTVPSVSRLDIGNLLGTANTQLNGWFLQLSYYPLRVTNSEVQAFSK